MSSNLAIVEEGFSPEEALEQLKIYASEAAEGIRGFIQTCDMPRYHNFLDMMYHYTLPSADLLQQAADKSHTDELKHYFEHMAEEERGHYLLAKADLKKGFAMDVTPDTPPVIQRYIDFWEGISREHAAAYLGAVSVFENVAGNVYQDVLALIERLELTKRQSTWLIVHLEADEDHGAEAYQFAEKYLPEYSDTILWGAKQATQLWVDIFSEAFGKDYSGGMI